MKINFHFQPWNRISLWRVCMSDAAVCILILWFFFKIRWWLSSGRVMTLTFPKTLWDLDRYGITEPFPLFPNISFCSWAISYCPKWHYCTETVNFTGNLIIINYPSALCSVQKKIHFGQHMCYTNYCTKPAVYRRYLCEMPILADFYCPTVKLSKLYCASVFLFEYRTYSQSQLEQRGTLTCASARVAQLTAKKSKVEFSQLHRLQWKINTRKAEV